MPLEVGRLKKESLLNRLLASSMHLFSLLLTFVLPLLVYVVTKGRNNYFANHAKEGMNLHFTFLPILLILSFVSKKINIVSILSISFIILETILIVIATIYTLKGKKFSYPVIRYFKE